MPPTEKKGKKIEHIWVVLRAAMTLLITGFTTTASAQNEFITTWWAIGNSIEIPTEGGGYNYNISWEEIGNPANNGSATGVAGDYTISVANENQYRVKISGNFPRIFCSELSLERKLLPMTVEQWGNISWTSMHQAFSGCNDLVISATDAPDLSQVTDLSHMFALARNFNSDIGHWDVSNVTNMEAVFSGARSFNQDISNWDVSNVTSMLFMFLEAHAFNQDISTWDVRNVTTMQGMFSNAFAFNQDIGNWDVSNVVTLFAMFLGATSFNQDIGSWDVNQVTNIAHMFWGATSFNQDISNWDLSGATSLRRMFYGATSFNQDIGNWNVSNVTTMESMFEGATSFNQNIDDWDVSEVTNMFSMFQSSSFNQDISSWDVSKVTNMAQMFNGAPSFNQDIGNWNVSNVTRMDRMFANATSFAQDIGNWNVGNVTRMEFMFANVTTFNQNLGNWDVSNVTQMSSMLNGCGLSRENYDLTLQGWASKNVKTNVSLGASGLKYCDGQTSRNILISGKGWTITGDAKYCPQTITFNTLSAQTYGDVFNLTATASSGLPVTFSSSDPSTASISGTTVTVLKAGSVTITASQGGNANFEAASPAQQPLTLNPKPVTITVNAGQQKIYGEVDPVLTYSVFPALINGDVFSGALARVAGENIGDYAINQNTLTAGNNYAITFTSDNFHIGPKAIIVTVNTGQTKIYGDSDPDLTYAVSPPLINGDAFSGVLARTAGENIGDYAINQNTLTAGNNYAITFTSDNFHISPKAITVIASTGQFKIYGDIDPAFTYSVSPPLINGDVVSGVLARTAGENVGDYAISQNTLTAGNNYAITFISDNFQIAPKPITVTASPGQTKIYGDADPTFTYAVSPALINGDDFSGVLTRAAGENVGTYAFVQGTLSAGNNYVITINSNDFQITPKAITVTATAGQSKVYGDADPTFNFSVAPPLISGDVFSGSLARAAGENVGAYTINQNTLTAGSNYVITFSSVNFQIIRKAITVTARSGQSKNYGEADPALTYSVSPELINGDVFSGVLARASGENVGAYPIIQNTLTAGNNYTVIFTGADFNILKLHQTISFNPLQDKTFGDDPFSITATASSSLPVSFTSSDETVAMISGNVVTIAGAGQVTITAMQEGNDIYHPEEISVTLTVHPADLFIPTLFSPDGNGVNDSFHVHGADIEEILFVVFDRFGKEVYRATDVETATKRGWDGKREGDDLPSGTYSWMLKGKFKNGSLLSFNGKSYGQVVLAR